MDFCQFDNRVFGDDTFFKLQPDVKFGLDGIISDPKNQIMVELHNHHERDLERACAVNIMWREQYASLDKDEEGNVTLFSYSKYARSKLAFIPMNNIIVPCTFVGHAKVGPYVLPVYRTVGNVNMVMSFKMMGELTYSELHYLPEGTAIREVVDSEVASRRLDLLTIMQPVRETICNATEAALYTRYLQDYSFERLYAMAHTSLKKSMHEILLADIMLNKMKPVKRFHFN